MIRGMIYKLVLAMIVINMIMIALNGLGIVKYRFNNITSYSSRVVILLVIVIFVLAIWDYKRSEEVNTEAIEEMPPPIPRERIEMSNAFKHTENPTQPKNPELNTGQVEHQGQALEINNPIKLRPARQTTQTQRARQIRRRPKKIQL